MIIDVTLYYGGDGKVGGGSILLMISFGILSKSKWRHMAFYKKTLIMLIYDNKQYLYTLTLRYFTSRGPRQS